MSDECNSWQVAKVKCQNCGHGHIAVFPTCAKKPMKCDDCGEIACRVMRYYLPSEDAGE